MRPKIGFKKLNIEKRSYIDKCNFAKWDGKPKRKPLKGELFISGSVPVAYYAHNDMSQEYFIAVIHK